MDPEDEIVCDTDPLAPRTRVDGGQVEEGVTCGGPEDALICATTGDPGICAALRGTNQNPGQERDPEDGDISAAHTSAPHAREAGGPVEEGQTWGGPEGVETFMVKVDVMLQVLVPPPT